MSADFHAGWVFDLGVAGEWQPGCSVDVPKPLRDRKKATQVRKAHSRACLRG